MSKSVSILGLYQDAAREKLAKLAKRAARYGQSITWTERPFTVEATQYRWDGKPKKVLVQKVEFVIDGSAPKAGDYRFLAALEAESGGVIISAVPGVEIGELGRAWDGRCEHCGTKRSRRSAFVVEDAQGTRKIVGKSCLRDHMGTDSPEGLISIFTALRDAQNFGDEEGWTGGGRWSETTLGVIAASRAAIALWGWIPASRDGMTTRGYATLAFAPPTKSNYEDRKRLLDELAANADRYEETAQKVIEWGRALAGRSDYEHNLKVALAGDWVSDKTLGLVVSAAAAYDRQKAVEEERKAKAAALPPSYHFGEVGVRASAIVTVERLIGLPDYGFGPSTLVVMREEKGALLSWKTQGSTKLDGKPVEVGTRAKATFTPKAHAEFQGTPETRVSRCKFETVAA